MINSEFSWPVRIYYEDTDAGGIVYNANYLKFLERARTEWLRQLGIEQDQLLQHNVAFVVRHIDIEFRNAARFNQLLAVSCRVAQLKRASMVFSQVIADETGRVIVTANVTIACVNLAAMKPIAIPEDVSGVIARATS
ncbi:tol-pal system-associated acyl-CoA thioesterase [Tolumonas auensis DSM 9187]|jgi:acyl-CoA thioester hydrolase|uniref:Tol-pal system-associated acyl-CoA thioesterase n=1 Tax=Tolumonas auensis (strain DSM 9187 / NBRC 110442 / TA 4) TaxID=595494 RepID=C4LBM6_TOLAT|nr:tol-pal system-associated acyl-CoA thioesterase [Tolumonas auensis]ACQ94300.1 tol-pal system-associated acyl-CoA thioesterase [Tolumonas auensis DSM 9187]